VLSLLVELGVSCIHPVCYGVCPPALFDMYFTYQKK